MPATRPPSDAVLARAAELRAAGATWDAVAAELGRPARTLRRWPRRYPGRWAGALKAADRSAVAEAGAEAVLVLRQLLRSDDDKVRRDAARALVFLRLELAKLDHRAAGPAPPAAASPAAELVAFLEGHTDEQLAELAADLYRPALPAPRAPRPPDVAGPG